MLLRPWQEKFDPTVVALLFVMRDGGGDMVGMSKEKDGRTTLLNFPAKMACFIELLSFWKLYKRFASKKATTDYKADCILLGEFRDTN